MTILQGVTIKLRTGEDTDRPSRSGTDNHLYLGIHGGKTGGVEFAIYSSDRKFDDFETGETNYFAGKVPNSIKDNPAWEECRVTAQVQDKLLFHNMKIDADQIDTVYLRKNGDLSHDDDDEYLLKSIEVELLYLNQITNRNHTKVFSFYAGNEDADPDNRYDSSEGLYLSNESGLKVWLHAGGLTKVYREKD